MRKQRIINQRFPHHVKVVRITYPGRYSNETEPTGTVIYSGEGRCYSNGSVDGRQVDISHRYISIPVNVKGWGGLHPLSGDAVTVTMGKITETMEVKDFEPDNNRTVLYCERNGNIDE